MKKFEKGGKEWELLADFCDLLQKYLWVPADTDEDNFWESLIRDAEAFSKKHRWKDDLFPVKLIYLIIEHAEDQTERQEILCDIGHNAPVATLMKHLMIKE